MDKKTNKIRIIIKELSENELKIKQKHRTELINPYNKIRVQLVSLVGWVKKKRIVIK